MNRKLLFIVIAGIFATSEGSAQKTFPRDTVIHELTYGMKKGGWSSYNQFDTLNVLLYEFKYGIGPETREFVENSVMTKGVKDFYLVEEGRDHFYKNRAKLYFQSLKEQNNHLLLLLMR
jgi:hypothetical protein